MTHNCTTVVNYEQTCTPKDNAPRSGCCLLQAPGSPDTHCSCPEPGALHSHREDCSKVAASWTINLERPSVVCWLDDGVCSKVSVKHAVRNLLSLMLSNVFRQALSDLAPTNLFQATINNSSKRGQILNPKRKVPHSKFPNQSSPPLIRKSIDPNPEPRSVEFDCCSITFAHKTATLRIRGIKELFDISRNTHYGSGSSSSNHIRKVIYGSSQTAP